MPATLRGTYIRRSGGVARARIFTRAFLALIGQWPWRRLAHVPVELILLPADGPLSVYDFACWARQTMVSLSVVEALQPVRPSAIDLSEIGGRGQIGAVRGPRACRSAAGAQSASPSAGCASGRRPTARGAGSSRPGCGRSIMLAALGHGFEDETFARGARRAGSGSLIRDGDRLRPEACQSPIWDTALAVLALRAAGVPADDPPASGRGRLAARARR